MAILIKKRELAHIIGKRCYDTGCCDFHRIKAKWYSEGTYAGMPTFDLSNPSDGGTVCIQRMESTGCNNYYLCISTEGGPWFRGTLRECLKHYDKHFYKEEKMKEVNKKIKWEFTTDNEMWSSKEGIWKHKDYTIFFNYRARLYRLVHKSDGTTIFESTSVEKVFDYANKYIKDPKYKVSLDLLEKAEALEKEAASIKERAAELRKRAENM